MKVNSVYQVLKSSSADHPNTTNELCNRSGLVGQVDDGG